MRRARALRDSGLSAAQERVARGAWTLGGSGLSTARKRMMLSAAQKRALRAARRRAMKNARRGAVRGAEFVRDARRSDVPQRVMQGAQRTAERLGPTADQARDMAVTGLYTARVWSAPRIDRAGDYVEHYLGPRVGSLLRWTATRVEPARSRRARRGIAAGLVVAGGAIGAAGAIATRRSMAHRQADEQSSQASTERLSAVPENSNGERAHTS